MRQSIRGLYSTMYQGLLRLDNVPHPSDAELELARARSEEAQRECDRLRGEAEQLRSKVSELEAKASGRESLATVGQQLEAIRSQFATLSSGQVRCCCLVVHWICPPRLPWADYHRLQGDLMPSVVSVASVREVVTAEVCVGTQDYPFQAPPAKVEAWKNKIAAARKETSDAKLEIERLKAEIARTSGKRKAEDPVPPPGKIAKNGAGRVEANSGAGTSSCKGQSALPLPGCVPIGKRRLQELESAEAELVTVRRQASQSSANAERWQNIAIKNGNDAKTAKGRIENMEKEQATNRARIAELKHQVHVAALRTQAVNQDTAARLEGMERRAQQSRIELESYRQRLSEMNVVTSHQQERVAALEADLGAKVSELATAATILRTNEQHIEELRRQLAASQRETNSQHIEELRRQLTAAQQEANKYQKLWTEAEKAIKEYRNPTSGGSGSSGSYTPSDRSRPRRRW